jgi:hypothetical protein
MVVATEKATKKKKKKKKTFFYKLKKKVFHALTISFFLNTGNNPKLNRLARLTTTQILTKRSQ